MKKKPRKPKPKVSTQILKTGGLSDEEIERGRLANEAAYQQRLMRDYHALAAGIITALVDDHGFTTGQAQTAIDKGIANARELMK